MKMELRSDNRDSAESSGGSQSTARALSVLNLLGDSPEHLGVREIARRLDLAPSIVHRLIQTLTDYGYVERSASGQGYRIGFRAFQVGRSYLAQRDLHAASLPELRAMADRDQVNAYLGVLREGAIVYLEAIQSSGPIVIVSTPGARARLHSTAFGKALLAELPDDEVAALLGPEPFERVTPKTRTKFAAFLKDLREVRRTGCAVSDEENIAGVFAAGAVIRDATGRAVAALSGAVPRHQLDAAGIEKLRRTVVSAAQRVSQRLGADAASRAPRPLRTAPLTRG